MAIQSPTEHRQAAERDAYCRLVEKAAARECSLLNALEEGKAREEKPLSLLQIHQAQHNKSKTQIQEP